MKFSGLALFLASSLMAAPSSAQEAISVHGSGTSNPSKCYWTIMGQMMMQSKVPTRMTYRSVGSGTGQKEFMGNGTVSVSMFGSAGIPMSQDKFDAFPQDSFLHLPVLLGAITFFHSAPTGGQELSLAPCTIAKIFKREITDWGHPDVISQNPQISFPKSAPITVAHRVKGSSSTASVTQYLHQVCPDEWPADLVGKTITWPADTIGCEGSGGMSTCIKESPGTIGYIDMGHGHSEDLPEIELINAAQRYISTKEAAERGGIMAALQNAALPDSLSESFADVNLLNRGGPNTWPITTISYIFVKKDLTWIENPASQSLVKAFIKAVYSDEYITQCEEEFGFVRVAGELRNKALQAVDQLVLSPGAPEWTFEADTEPIIGMGDYVISSKRQSTSEIVQDKLIEKVNKLEKLVAELSGVSVSTGAVHTTSTGVSQPSSNALGSFIDQEMDEDEQVKTAFILSIVSIALWGVAIGMFILVLFIKACSSSSKTTEVKPAGEMMESGMY